MAIGETDDPNAIIEGFEAAAVVTKGDPVYLSADNKVSPATTTQDCIGVAVKSAAPRTRQNRLPAKHNLRANTGVDGGNRRRSLLRQQRRVRHPLRNGKALPEPRSPSASARA
jgi:hypothetical protein